ncbi:cadmium-exporting ATPase [Clostridium sp. CAG:813]|nr:cadmium-exporting ATPase [Clostridium sp. CAG:813]
MLTGDTEESGLTVAKELNLDKAYTQLLPIDKVDKIEDIIEQKTKNKSVIFVGDGINDAPVLTRADVGIAMGGLGSDAAIEAADVVIMDDKPTKVATAIKIAKQTLTIVKENIAFALGIKVLFLILGAFGFVTMWGAVFADVGVTLIAVLNSLRALKIK